MFEYISLKFKKTLANRVRGIDSNPYFPTNNRPESRLMKADDTSWDTVHVVVAFCLFKLS